MRNFLRAAERIALAAFLAFAAATCTDQPTGPGGEQAARVQFTPILPSGVFAAGIPLDNIVVTVVRPAAETLAVVTAPFDVADSVLQLDVPVTLLADQEDLVVTIQLLNGVSILFTGTDTIPVTADPAGSTAPPIALTYVGPGANIAFLSVSPRDTVLSLGDTLVYGASAADALENPVAQFYLRWWTTPAGTPIRSDGRLIAPLVRGSVMVHAWTPSGEEDSTRVTFIPVPSQLQKSAGDGQTDTIADTLVNPLVVQVKAADNLGVQGIPVTFAAVTAGGSVVSTNAITDSLGFAGAQAVLGDTARVYSYTATVAGLTPVTFTATATADAPAAIAKQSGDAQSDTALQTLPQPLVVRVTDAAGNPVTGAKVYWTRVFGTGAVSADSTVTAATGSTQITYTLNAPGTDSIRAQIAGTGAFVTFTATGVAGGFSIVEVSGNGQVDTVGQTLSTPMVAEVRVQGSAIPAPGVMVQFSILYGGGSLSVDSALSDSLGRVQVTYTLDTLAGYAEVMAETPTAGQYVTFQIQKVAAAPDHLHLFNAPADTQRAGLPFAPVPVIEVRDQYGNPVKVAGTTLFARTEFDLNPPAAPRMASGVLQLSGGVVAGDSAVTDTLGRAAFAGLTVDGSVGPETMHFFGDTTVMPMLDFPFTIAAGNAASVVPWNGNGQTAFVDSLVAIAPEVLVVDGSGNAVAGVQVDFVVTGGGGAVTGGTQITDSTGHATVGSWRMGPTPGADTLEAQVAGATPAVFTATAQPLTPTIQLSLLNTNVVGVGRTATLLVKLSRPDTLGVVVSLLSTNPGVVQLDSASASYGPVDTVRFRVLTGVSAGNADIIATAPGYEPDTLTVTGSLNLITLPTTSNVALGQTASLPVQLALPAPAGGVVVNVTSLDPSHVSVVTPTVTFNAGEQLKNATVSGVALGTAQVVAENPNYAPDTSLVSTTATLNITATSLTAFSTFGAAFTTEFRSNGALTPAPAGGIVVTLTPRDPTCVAAPATITIPQGQTSFTDSLDYGGGATLPCVTYLDATAPGIDPDSVQVTITQPPATTISFVSTTVGSGMQDGSFSVSLGTGAHGGRLLTLRTLTTGVTLIQKDAVTAGADSIGIFVPNTTTSASFYVAGLEGITSDSALIVSEMTGFRPDTAKVYVRQGAIDLQQVPASVNVLAGNTNIWVQMGVPNVALTTMNAYMGPRVGGSLSRLATISVTPGAVAMLKDTAAVEDSIRSVTFPVGQYYTPTSGVNGIALDPVGVGTATVTASVPGLLSLPLATRTMTVNPAGLTLNNTTIEVGAGLQDGTYGLNLSGANHGGVTVALKVLTPGVAVLQPNATTLGADSIGLPIANGSTGATFYVAGLEGIGNDSVRVVASVPGFNADTLLVRVRQPAIDLQQVPSTTNSLAGNTNIWVQIGIPNVAQTTMNAYQGPRFGGTLGRVASVSVTPGTVALLRDSTLTPDSTKSVTIPVGQYYSATSGVTGMQIDPQAPGVAVFQASMPGFVPLPLATRSMTVTGPAITLSNTTLEVGSGLQDGAYGVNLSASAHGGVTLTLRLLGTGVAVLQPNGTTAGTDSIQVFIPNGTASTSYYVGGLEGITSDSVRMEASIPGFTPDTVLIRVRRAAFDLQQVPANTTTLSPNTAIWVQMGVPNVAGTSMNAYQGTRAGQPAESIWVKSTSPTVARVANSSTSDDSLLVAFPAGQYYTPTSVASGGIAVDPLTTGTTTFVAVHPVFLALPLATRPVTVATPAITVNGGTVGSGLQRSQSFSLGASQHGGVNVVVKSTAPSILKVSPNATTPGTDSIVVFVANGNTNVGFIIQGMEGQTGSPSLNVSAPGFSDGTAGATVVAPAIDVQQVPTSVSAGAGNTAIWAQIGVPNGPLTSMNEYQDLRAGGPGAVTVTFTNGTAGVAQFVTTALTADVVTALITPGLYYTPTSVGTGGVAFDPLGTGSTTVTVSASGFIALPGATRTVNVTP